MSALQPPLMGHAPPLECNRWLGGGHCGKPGTWHIIWTVDAENGIACDEHMDEARQKWVFVGAHVYRMECSMPGAVYLYAEDICIVPEDEPALNAEAAMEQATRA